MQSRRQFLKTAARGTAAAVAVSALGCAKPKRPNILFIMSDDHAKAAMSCYGSILNETPNLDRLAREGIKFKHCLCNNSICGPSRATILTGKYSHINGFMLNETTKFDGSQQTFPKLLQGVGYETAVIGKWHLGSAPTGFDYWDVLPGQGSYYDPEFIKNGETEQHQGYVTDIITDKALDWLQTRSDDTPFFLAYQHKAPHSNWQPAQRHKSLYADQELPVPDNYFDDYQTRSQAAWDNQMSIAEHLDLQYRNDPELYDPPDNLNEKELALWKYQYYIKNYLRCVKAVDENVGRILDYLDETGLADDYAIVVYTSIRGFSWASMAIMTNGSCTKSP
ncbi:MAG: sulfatase-like hydrolase/transferase [candidate division KSB1 bacterium]|nr:sulfatase-like hydrolase/transferase [candidate division KSB1 bacterium]